MEQFFYLHDVNFWLSCFGPSFRYNLVTIGVLEFVVVIDVYAQPTREKIKFYRTASEVILQRCPLGRDGQMEGPDGLRRGRTEPCWSGRPCLWIGNGGEQGLPVREDDVCRDGAQVLEEAVLGAAGGHGSAPREDAQVGGGVEGEGTVKRLGSSRHGHLGDGIDFGFEQLAEAGTEFTVAQRTWSRRSVPRRDHRICCALVMRRLTRKLAVPSVIDVPTRRPAR